MASRRAAIPSRRSSDGASFAPKSRTFSVLLLLFVVFVVIVYVSRSNSGSSSNADKNMIGRFMRAGVAESVSKGDDASCTLEVQQAIPTLRNVYGDSMRKVLHIGPNSCGVVSMLLKVEGIQAWGVEPYDLEDVDSACKKLVRKGLVRVVDIKYPLPYRQKSFSLVIVSDALDYLSQKHLNKTLPEFARVSEDGVVLFAGFPGQQRAKVSELSKFGRPAKFRGSSWWERYFVKNGLKENDNMMKKFEQAATQMSYRPSCQVFLLSS